MTDLEDLIAEHDERLHAIETTNEEKYLRQSGIAQPMWGKKLYWPGTSARDHKKRFYAVADDVRKAYAECTNVMISGGLRETRMEVASCLALHVRDQRNLYCRDVVGYKHTKIASSDGVVIDWPFQVAMRDVEELGVLRKERDRAVERDPYDFSWEDEVLRPDFYFLTEVGHEWANTWNAKIIEDFLAIRADAGLPVVVTTAKSIKSVMDKKGDSVYAEIARILDTFDWVELA